ncbi:TPA: hypothetical protein ACHK59_004858, partial [Escherichia coli]
GSRTGAPAVTTDDDHDDDDSSSAVTDCPENDRAAVREFCYTRYLVRFPALTPDIYRGFPRFLIVMLSHLG